MTTGKKIRLSLAGGVLVLLASCAGSNNQTEVTRAALPAMAWDHRPEAGQWTRATLAALQTDGAGLLKIVPRDIALFCPDYRNAGPADRAAFWSGMLSALAKFESTWRPEASGGGGRWIGLVQIDPRTARGYGCAAQSVGALKDGAANLACAVRIVAAQVGRDELLVSEAGNWRGMARDWAPFRDPAKRADMAAWTSRQSYCQTMS
ncbi:MAG: transglycosylase SLT domain-containing protein [Paracoccaceae bacterium]